MPLVLTPADFCLVGILAWATFAFYIFWSIPSPTPRERVPNETPENSSDEEDNFEYYDGEEGEEEPSEDHEEDGEAHNDEDEDEDEDEQEPEEGEEAPNNEESDSDSEDLV